MIASCEELVDLSTEYFERTLDAASRLRFDARVALLEAFRAWKVGR
jgi:hypothetical protein